MMFVRATRPRSIARALYEDYAVELLVSASDRERYRGAVGERVRVWHRRNGTAHITRRCDRRVFHGPAGSQIRARGNRHQYRRCATAIAETGAGRARPLRRRFMMGGAVGSVALRRHTASHLRHCGHADHLRCHATVRGARAQHHGLGQCNAEPDAPHGGNYANPQRASHPETYRRTISKDILARSGMARPGANRWENSRQSGQPVSCRTMILGTFGRPGPG